MKKGIVGRLIECSILRIRFVYFFDVYGKFARQISKPIREYIINILMFFHKPVYYSLSHLKQSINCHVCLSSK